MTNPYQSSSPYSPVPAEPRGLSITSMVCGIVGIVMSFFGAGFLPALAAVILGHIAQKKERAGQPFWMTGLITGYIALLISVVVGLLFFAALLIPLFVIGASGGFA